VKKYLKSDSFFWTLVCAMVCLAAWSGFEVWSKTYDPIRGVNPFSSIAVSELDLSKTSKCAKELIVVKLKNNLKQTRSDLFYAEWQCSISSRSHAPV
jgi:hypothetical protein